MQLASTQTTFTTMSSTSEHQTGASANDRTPAQRAQWALRRACNGWRKDRQCRAAGGARLEAPHPGCVRAQEEHDHLLSNSDGSD